MNSFFTDNTFVYNNTKYMQICMDFSLRNFHIIDTCDVPVVQRTKVNISLLASLSVLHIINNWYTIFYVDKF